MYHVIFLPLAKKKKIEKKKMKQQMVDSLISLNLVNEVNKVPTDFVHIQDCSVHSYSKTTLYSQQIPDYICTCPCFE